MCFFSQKLVKSKFSQCNIVSYYGNRCGLIFLNFVSNDMEYLEKVEENLPFWEKRGRQNMLVSYSKNWLIFVQFVLLCITNFYRFFTNFYKRCFRITDFYTENCFKNHRLISMYHLIFGSWKWVCVRLCVYYIMHCTALLLQYRRKNGNML